MLGIGRIVDKKLDTAEKIAYIKLETAEKIAYITLKSAVSIAGSTEEAATLKKTEKMAHAAALGSANGATDALKSRWWVLWPW
jgi:hypothetical protein